MRIEPEIDGVSIVLLGDFNPAILTPAWFVLQGLLPKGAEESADVEAIHPQIASFHFDWFGVRVATDHFVATTEQAPHVRLRDLVAGAFGERLRHTPLRSLGINRYVHFRTGNPAARVRMGLALAPVEPWGEWGLGLGSSAEDGGVTSLTMTRLRPEGRPEGDRINVTVQPSVKIDDRRLGVYVGVNDHYGDEGSDRSGAMRLVDILEDRFDKSLKHSESIIDHLMSLAMK